MPPARAQENAVAASAPPAASAPAGSGSTTNANASASGECTASRAFADPQQAYAAYAQAVNGSDWCRAIQTFAPEQRPDVALANFKTLALAAGADNPKRDVYQQGFSRFCAEQRLSCGAPESTAALAQGLMLRLPLDAELAEIRALAAERPEAVYVALMRSLAGADPTAMGKFDLPLRELSIEGERATGKAPQRDGRLSTLPFVKSAPGWMLAAR